MTKNPLGKLGGGKLAGRNVRTETAAEAAPKPTAAVAVPGADVVHGKRRRGSSEVVSQTVRLRREDWVAMNEIKIATGMSAQEQFIRALAMWFDHNNKEPPKAP